MMEMVSLSIKEEYPEGKKFCHECGSEDIQLFKECENDFFVKQARKALVALG